MELQRLLRINGLTELWNYRGYAKTTSRAVATRSLVVCEAVAKP